MASVELRPIVRDADLEAVVTVVNRLVHTVRGDQGGRVWLIGDDGNKKAIAGSSAVPSGTVLSANNYPLRIEPTSTNQVNVLHSNGATIGLRVQDGGLTTGVPASMTSTLTVTGAATFNGAVTLGDAAADTVTITGTATFAEDVTMTKGLIVDTTTLVVDETTNRVGIGTATPQAGLEVASVIFATQTSAFPTTGAGIGVVYDTGAGYVYSYSYTGAVYTPLILQGLSVSLQAGAVETIKVDATGIGFFAHATAAQPAAGAAATDPASTQTLANALRTGLRALGLFS